MLISMPFLKTAILRNCKFSAFGGMHWGICMFSECEPRAYCSKISLSHWVELRFTVGNKHFLYR